MKPTWEDRTQTVIMLMMGAAAGAVCFTHVHDASVRFGQPSWVGWINAGTVELMAIALGLELRRRRRIPGAKIGFVAAAMSCFILLSLAAQVVDAQPSLGGWLAAAVPALGFLVLVKVALSRPALARPQHPPMPPPRPAPVDVPNMVAEPQAVTADTSAAPDWTQAFATSEGR